VVVGNIKKMSAFTIRSGSKSRFRNLWMIQVGVGNNLYTSVQGDF